MTIRKGKGRGAVPPSSQEEVVPDEDFRDPKTCELMNRVFRGEGVSPPRPAGPPRKARSPVETKGRFWYKGNAEKTSPAQRPPNGGSQTFQGATEMNAETKGTNEDPFKGKSKEEIFEAGRESGRAEEKAERAAAKTMSAAEKTKAFFAHNWGKMLLVVGAATAGVVGDRYYQRNYADGGRGGNNGGGNPNRNPDGTFADAGTGDRTDGGDNRGGDNRGGGRGGR